MVLDKYINIKESKNMAGQDTKTKEWYVKELYFDTPDEYERMAKRCNKVSNGLNKDIKIEPRIKMDTKAKDIIK